MGKAERSRADVDRTVEELESGRGAVVVESEDRVDRSSEEVPSACARSRSEVRLDSHTVDPYVYVDRSWARKCAVDTNVCEKVKARSFARLQVAALYFCDSSTLGRRTLAAQQ